MTLVQTEPKNIKIWTTAIKRVTIRPNWTEKQIRPAWWQPWANTLLYMPLNSTDTHTDKSWNSRATTNTNVSFWTYQWVDCWYLNGTSAHIQITPFTFSSELTLLIWLYPAWYTSWYDGKIFDARISSYAFTSRYGSYAQTIWISWYINWTQTFITDVSNKRVLFVMTSKNGSQTYQLLWDNINVTKTSSLSFSSFTPSRINLWNEYNNGANRFFKWWISECILENKARTDQEKIDYYNQTKSLYWIQTLNNSLSNTLTPAVIPNTQNNWSWDVLTI